MSEDRTGFTHFLPYTSTHRRRGCGKEEKNEISGSGRRDAEDLLSYLIFKSKDGPFEAKKNPEEDLFRHGRGSKKVIKGDVWQTRRPDATVVSYSANMDSYAQLVGQAASVRPGPSGA